MLYKDVDAEEASRIFTWCEDFNVNFDWWNAMSIAAGLHEPYQIGMTREDWDRYEQWDKGEMDHKD